VEQTNLIGHIGSIEMLTIADMNLLPITEGSLSQLCCVELLLGRIIYNSQHNLLTKQMSFINNFVVFNAII